VELLPELLHFAVYLFVAIDIGPELAHLFSKIVGVSPESARISLNPNLFTLMEKKLQGSYYGSTRPRMSRAAAVKSLAVEPGSNGSVKVDALGAPPPAA